MSALFNLYFQNSLCLSIVGIAIIAFSPLLSRRYSAKCRYYIWLVLMMALLIPIRPRIQITLPEFFQTIVPQTTEKSILNTSFIDGIASSSGTSWDWLQIASILWAAGALYILSWHTYHHFRFTSLVKRWSKDIKATDVLNSYKQVKSELGIKRSIKLQSCTFIKTPLMVGFLNPTILLPHIVFTEDELPLIIKHELIHYKRKDLWYKLLIMLVLTIHWFNPLIHFIVKSVQNLCEISCDEEVVKGTDVKSRARYGEAIVGVIKKGTSYRTPFSTNFYSGTKSVKERIFAIMDISSKRFSPFILTAVLVLILCGTTTFVLSAQKVKNTLDNTKQTKIASVNSNLIEPQTPSLPSLPVKNTENEPTTKDSLSTDGSTSTLGNLVKDASQLVKGEEQPTASESDTPNNDSSSSSNNTEYWRLQTVRNERVKNEPRLLGQGE